MCRKSDNSVYIYRHIIKAVYGFFFVALLLSISGCFQQSSKQQQKSISYLAKSDIDTVTDINLQNSLKHLRALAKKLYLRNPKELSKSGFKSANDAIKHIFSSANSSSKQNTHYLELAFDENFSGDRVYNLIKGMKNMIMASYENKSEFFMFDELDPQKLYNCARNMEIVAWKLNTARKSGGQLLILSNSMDGPVKNMSYERLFGKLIAQQDMMALIVSEKTNRSIKRIVQTLASAVFLPI